MLRGTSNSLIARAYLKRSDFILTCSSCPWWVGRRLCFPGLSGNQARREAGREGEGTSDGLGPEMKRSGLKATLSFLCSQLIGQDQSQDPTLSFAHHLLTHQVPRVQFNHVLRRWRAGKAWLIAPMSTTHGREETSIAQTFEGRFRHCPSRKKVMLLQAFVFLINM